MNQSVDQPKVTIIIPIWNSYRWLAGCLTALQQQHYQNFQTILVDGGSTDDSRSYLSQNFPQAKIVALPENRGFAAAINAGLALVETEYVALLNIDTVPRPAWLGELVRAIEQGPADVGCVTSKMLNLRNPAIIDDAGDTLSWYGSARKRGHGQAATNYIEPDEVFSACAGAALYRAEFFEQVGGLDEYFISYLEDVDLGLRGRLFGYRCLYVPAAEILHQGQSAGLRRSYYVYLMTRNRLALILKNIPLNLLVKHSAQLFFGQLYYLLVYKRPLHSVAGYISGLRRLGQILRQRRQIQQQRTVSDRSLEAALSNDLGEPSIRDIIKNKLSRLG
jgi:hypothetical protein